MKKCDNPNCDEVFQPRESKARFCCAYCRDQFWVGQRRQGLAMLRAQQVETEAQT